MIEPIHVTPGDDRDPFRTLMFIACLLTGLATLFIPPEAGSVAARAFPGWFIYLWSTGIVIGSSLALLGMLIHTEYRYALERVGLWLTAGMMIAYWVGLVSTPGVRVISSATMLLLSFSVACVWRVRKIQRILRSIKDVNE